MNIVADENIPFAQELFSHLGEVTLKAGRSLSNNDLARSDALLVRSVTKVNHALLYNTPVKFVGTSTIGTDHLEAAYLKKENITFHSAPGCNAQSVVQYVLCALAYIKRLNKALSIGIVGCGNVGGCLYKTLLSNGFNCKVYDPFLTHENIQDLSDLESVLSCDIVCLHTPLTKDGPYPTYHLIGKNELDLMKPGGVLLNAGRGEVIDNSVLLKRLKAESNSHNKQLGFSLKSHLILDVWENEPNILAELFSYVSIGTPHIAGYSFEGKVNGTTMIFRRLAKFLKYDDSWIDEKVNNLRDKYLFSVDEALSDACDVNELLLSTYNILDDHDRLGGELDELPLSFDSLRKNYPTRREFSAYRIAGKKHLSEDHTFLNALGFTFRD